MTSGEAGLLLLSGGRSRRMGAAKHALAHPAGGTWGGHLARVFESVFPGAPIRVLGAPLSDRPDLPVFDDPRQGPAAALRTWALTEAASPRRWWVVACDQVRWTPERLAAWARRAEAADPEATRWVLAQHAGHLQPLGGWLPDRFRPRLAAAPHRSLMALAEALPHLLLPCDGPEWIDVDTPEERREFEAES